MPTCRNLDAMIRKTPKAWSSLRLHSHMDSSALRSEKHCPIHTSTNLDETETGDGPSIHLGYVALPTIVVPASNCLAITAKQRGVTLPCWDLSVEDAWFQRRNVALPKGVMSTSNHTPVGSKKNTVTSAGRDLDVAHTLVQWRNVALTKGVGSAGHNGSITSQQEGVTPACRYHGRSTLSVYSKLDLHTVSNCKK